MPRNLKLFRGSWCIREEGEWRELDPENAYTSKFLNDLNSCDLKNPLSDYINELFLYYYIKVRELNATAGGVNKASYAWNSRLADRGILFALRKGSRFSLSLPDMLLFYVQALVVFSLSILLAILVATLLPFIFLIKNVMALRLTSLDLKSVRNVFFVRSKSGYSRAKAFIAEDPGCVVLIDDAAGLKVPGQSIYSVLCWRRFSTIYIKTLQYTVRDCSLFFKDAKALLGTWFAFSVFWDYWKRIPQKSLYEACFVSILEFLPDDAQLFSGEKEDRFALLQTRCCARKATKLTCLPHGLEYGFKFPGGLCGDSFYCFSINAKRTLEGLYSSNKFLYSDDILNKMLGLSIDGCKGRVSRVCFFTEPRDQKINFDIIERLSDMRFSFSLKLHPIEDESVYRDRYPGIDIISDLGDALRSSVCISRKSTVLIEAAQRGQRSIALLENKKDRFYAEYLFPSLSSEKVLKVLDLNDLVEVIAVNDGG